MALKKKKKKKKSKNGKQLTLPPHNDGVKSQIFTFLPQANQREQDIEFTPSKLFRSAPSSRPHDVQDSILLFCV
jgi:hypothetical protein